MPMDHVFSCWDKLKEKLGGKFIFLFLDFDGTLAPIVQRPDKAKASPEALRIIKSLSERLDCKLAIISGRSLEDIKKRVGLKNIIYSGNHGMQVESPTIKYEPKISTGQIKALNKIKKELVEKVSKIKGVFIEDKGLSIALHFRQVNNDKVNVIKTIFREVTILPSVQKAIKIRSGKKVLEASLPAEWDKGRIVLWLLSRQQFKLDGSEIVPIYIGDDTTDEDAFKALKKNGITIFVGRPKDSAANYYLRDSKEVTRLLGCILNSR